VTGFEWRKAAEGWKLREFVRRMIFHRHVLFKISQKIYEKSGDHEQVHGEHEKLFQ
jgi:hypothetical protein